MKALHTYRASTSPEHIRSSDLGLMLSVFVWQALTASMDAGSQAALQGMMQHAEEVRLKPA